MSAATAMNLRHLIDTFRILNMDHDESTVSEERFPFQNSFKNNSYIVSDVDEELLLLVEFHDFVDLHSIKIHALTINQDTKTDDDEDDDDEEDKDDISAPKQVQIFKIEDLSKDFSDIKDMKPNHSLDLKPKKLSKGQLINLKKKSKIAVKFKKIKCLCLFIGSNQNQTEKTYLNGIILSGKCDAKLAYDIPYTAVTDKNKQKYSEIVAMFDKLDKKKVGLANVLKANEFSISNELMHSLLSYISRIPLNTNDNSTLQKLYSNDNEYGAKWIKDTVHIYDDDKRLMIEQNTITKNLKDDDYGEKMSYALMKILCNDDGGREIKLFLDKKIEYIVFHSMLIFHPWSEGNIYHSVEILKCAFKNYPFKLYDILTRKHSVVVHQLFKYALMSRTHEAKFGEFLLMLLLFKEGDTQRIDKVRAQLIGVLKSWRYLENAIEIGSNSRVYGEDISSKYCQVIVTLLKQCAKMKEAVSLFYANDKNVLSLIVRKLLKGALDKEDNGKWYRIHSVKMVIQIVDDVSDTKVFEKKRGKIIDSTHNYLYDLFRDTLKTLGEYMPLVINEIIDVDSKDIVDNVRVKKPLGLYRLKCFELFVLYLSVGFRQKSTFEELISKENVNKLCATLINMALIHINNNLFLVQFRNFLNILDKHCIDILKYMMIECDMLQRFIGYYNNNVVPSALKSFVISILWDINSNSSNKGKKWSFAEYVESNNDAKQFMITVEKQINLQKPTKV